MKRRLACFLVALAASPSPSFAERVPIGDIFAIDRTEVTIGEFRAFASAKALTTAAEREGGGFEFGAGWERRPGWSVYRPFGYDPGSDSEPAVHVSWHEARSYCKAKGGSLPTREEWSIAAFREMRAQPINGFVLGKIYRYPIGNKPTGMNTADPDQWPRHAPAGSTVAGINGLYDMGGNVWEWLADRQGDDALTAGGSWWYGPSKARHAAMQWKPAAFYAVYVGFRCAYPAES